MAVEDLEAGKGSVGETVGDLRCLLETGDATVRNYLNREMAVGVRLDSELVELYRNLVGNEFRSRIERALGKTIKI